MKEELYRIVMPWRNKACFGIVVKDGRVIHAAPIGKWMKGKNIRFITGWIYDRGGRIENLSSMNG